MGVLAYFSIHSLFAGIATGGYTITILSMLVFIFGFPKVIRARQPVYYSTSFFSAIISYVGFATSAWSGLKLTYAFEQTPLFPKVINEISLKEPLCYLALILFTIGLIIRIAKYRELSGEYRYGARALLYTVLGCELFGFVFLLVIQVISMFITSQLVFG